MSNFYSFIYLDDGSIDDLYPQIFGDIIDGRITHSSENSSDASINSNLLTLLGLNVSGKQNSIVSENVRFITSPARKAQFLINHFQTNISSLQDIISNSQPFEQDVCFVGKATFF